MERATAKLRAMGIPVDNIKPDDFMTYVTGKCGAAINPFSLITEQTGYLIETVQLFEGEGGLSLPCDYSQVPCFFFDAVKELRSARARAYKEHEAKTNKKGK